MSKNDQWEEASTEIDGFWDFKEALQFTPLNYFTFDSKKFRGRKVTVITGRLDMPAGLLDKDGEEFTGEAGTTVGVWYSAGMRELMNLADCKVRMKRDETLDKDVGQPQPMKGYRIQFAKGSVRRPLPEAPRFGAQSSEVPSEQQQNFAGDDYDNPPF